MKKIEARGWNFEKEMIVSETEAGLFVEKESLLDFLLKLKKEADAFEILVDGENLE